MTNTLPKQSVESVYPQVKGVQVNTKKEVIALAYKVATALRKERDNLVKEQLQNNTSSRLLQPAS